MLEESRDELYEASAKELQFAERFARTFMIASLLEDLIKPADAEATVDDHERQTTEEWKRNVHCVLYSLRKLKTEGYQLVAGGGAPVLQR